MNSSEQTRQHTFLFLSVHASIYLSTPNFLYIPEVNWSKSRSFPESEELLSCPIRHTKVV